MPRYRSTTLAKGADEHLSGPDEVLAGGEDDCAVSPETELWRAVIRQAFMDLGIAFADRGGGSNRGTAKVGGPDWRRAVRLRREAIRWFCSEAERGDFTEVCDLAGYDPAAIQCMAEKIIAERREEWTAEEIDAEFSALLRQANRMDKADLDRELATLAAMETA